MQTLRMVVLRNKQVIIGIIVIVSFLVLAFNLFPLLGLQDHAQECIAEQGFCPHEQQLNFLQGALPVLISAAVLIGAITYYLMGQRVEATQASVKHNAETVLKLLNPDERKLVNLLLENNGKVLQAEVTRLPGMTKVKSHRIVQRLVERNVVEVEQLGKTNIVKFTKEIKEGLL
jgi:uncharacterized membrane protein